MEANSAFGTLLKIGDGVTPTEGFADVDGVRDLNGPSQSIETIDTTHHTSPGNYREVIPSFKSAGEISFNLLYDSTDAEHILLRDAFKNREKTNFKVVFTDAGDEQLAFAAYVTQFEYAAPIDDALTVAVTLTITGDITIS